MTDVHTDPSSSVFAAHRSSVEGRDGQSSPRSQLAPVLGNRH